MKFALILIVLLLVLAAVHYYLALRLTQLLSAVLPRLRFVWVMLALILLSVMLLLSVARPFSGIPQRVISAIGTAWMGLFVYLLLFFLLSELVLLCTRPFASCLPKTVFVTRLVALSLALLTVLGGFLHARRIKTVSYSVSLGTGKGEQMRVVMLSDLHLGAVGSEARLESIVETINAEQPDLVCIAGDFFDNDYAAILDPERAERILRGIRSVHGVYACLGNHDAGAQLDEMLAFLQRSQIRLLQDEYTVIDTSLVLVGRIDPSPIGTGTGKERAPLSEILSDADPSLAVAVLDHNPARLGEYADPSLLVLSGHTHRGQIFPGSLMTQAMYSIDYGFGRTEGGSPIIVSSGVGTWGPPIRVGTDCQIVSISLSY